MLWCGAALCEERDSAGSTVTKQFFSQGEQIGGTNYFFSRDHLGSIREMTDNSGTLRARYNYDPWGRRTKTSGDLEADFGFTGHYYHAPSGMHLAPYRAYSTEFGRWLSRDPIEAAELLPEGPNIYTYVDNNPLNQIDPYGLCFKDCWSKCIEDTYGKSYDVALDLSFFSILGLAQDMFNTAVEAAALQKVKDLYLSGAYKEGDIIAKILAAEKAAGAATSLSFWTKWLSFLSKAASIIGAGPTGYVIGASAYCAAKCL